MHVAIVGGGTAAASMAMLHRQQPASPSSRRFIPGDGTRGRVARRTLVADRLANGAYALAERREPSSGDSEPIATALSRRAVFEFVDFRAHDALVIREDRETTYFVLPFSIPTGDFLTPSGGACVALRPEAGLGEEYLRGWTHAMKEALGDAIESGLLDGRAATVYFESHARRFADATEVIVPQR